jgi:hypothetical protein
VLVLFSAMTFYAESFASLAYSQVVGNPQIWKHSENNVRILFSHSPDNPAINTPTELRFTINDLRSGAAFKNVLVTVTIVGNNSGDSKKVVLYC